MKEGWERVSLGEIASEMYRGAGIRRDQITESGIPCVRYGEIYTTYNYAFEKCESHTQELSISSRKYFEHGDILFAITGESVEDIGKSIAYLGNERCLAGSDIVVMKHKQNPKFISYALSTRDAIKQKGWGKVKLKVVHTNIPSLEKIKINIPTSLSEQQRIVSYLDSAFAKIDAVAKNAGDALNEAKALFQSALTKMMEPKEGWSKKKFGDICIFVRGPFGGSLKKNCFKESGYAVYEQQNAIYNRFSFRYFIDEEKYNSMSRFKVETGDLIMSCSGTIGKVAIVPKDAKKGIINQALLKLTPSAKIDAEFLKYLMESNFFKGILSLNAGGAAINNIASVSTLKKIELSIPTVEEQREIVKKLNSIKKVFLNLSSNLTHTLTECAALKQAILRQTFE